MTIGVAREGQRGAIAPPKMPKKYIFNKKKLRQISIFLPRSLLGRLTTAIHGSGVPPQEVPPPRQFPGYAYVCDTPTNCMWNVQKVVKS